MECYAYPGLDRPDAFESKPGSYWTFSKYERVKP